jgi:hypothetical protein
MSNPGQPYLAQLQPQSNKKLWIILGSIIGACVIVMGGCVACGALIGISKLSKEDTTTSPSKSTGGGEGGSLRVSSMVDQPHCDDVMLNQRLLGEPQPSAHF